MCPPTERRGPSGADQRSGRCGAHPRPGGPAHQSELRDASWGARPSSSTQWWVLWVALDVLIIPSCLCLDTAAGVGFLKHRSRHVSLLLKAQRLPFTCGVKCRFLATLPTPGLAPSPVICAGLPDGPSARGTPPDVRGTYTLTSLGSLLRCQPRQVLSWPPWLKIASLAPRCLRSPGSFLRYTCCSTCRKPCNKLEFGFYDNLTNMLPHGALRGSWSHPLSFWTVFLILSLCAE